MAKLPEGLLSGVNGKVGTVVGYQWNGQWVVRAKVTPRNPKTEAQQERRSLFGEQMHLAATLRDVLRDTLTLTARGMHMTAYNLFVKMNGEAFGCAEGHLAVDWSRLHLSTGPVAPVAFDAPQMDDSGALSIEFERNPLHRRCSAVDYVYLYIHCPALEQGLLTAPVHRRQGRIDTLLPETFTGQELQLFGLVQDRKGEWSDTIYIDALQA